MTISGPSLYPLGKALEALAGRCDAICLTAGIQLGDAAPGLNDLSTRFVALSQMLMSEASIQPTQSLETVAQDLLTAETSLMAEREAVTIVINLNFALTRRIADLADNVRFLSSVVSNVKIEIATIGDGELRLDGFADNLKQLAAKSEVTVSAFRTTHETLVKQLHRTAAMQSAFVNTHGRDFATASHEIKAGLGAVSERSKRLASVAAEIGTITQKIGGEITRCVMGLQIGDSTRQRLEHVGQAISTAADIAGRVEADDVFDEHIDDAHRSSIVAQLCRLQIIQSEDASHDFSEDIGTIGKSITQITDAALALSTKSHALVSEPDGETHAFLDNLDAKLAFASKLIDECGRSRHLVDETAERVIALVLELQELAKSVSDMATDMMIIGTNAVVTSYRLGTSGIALSVIAQHLRNHAVQVTDAVQLVSPALGKVLVAAKQFTSAREGKDAASMEGLAIRIATALAAFKNNDGAVLDVKNRLDHEVSVVVGVLAKAADALDGIGGIEAELAAATETIEDLIGATDTDPDDAFPPSFDRVLRTRYTMDPERVIHDKFVSAAPAPRPRMSDADAVWL